MGVFTKIFGPSPQEVEMLSRLDAIRKDQRDCKRSLESLHRKVSTLMANQQKITVQVEELKGYLGTLATGVTVLTGTVDNLREQLELVKAESAVDTTELEAAVDQVGTIAGQLSAAINPGEDTPVIDPPEDGTPVVEPEVPGVVDEEPTDAPTDEPTDPATDPADAPSEDAPAAPTEDTTPGDAPEPGSTN